MLTRFAVAYSLKKVAYNILWQEVDTAQRKRKADEKEQFPTLRRLSGALGTLQLRDKKKPSNIRVRVVRSKKASIMKEQLKTFKGSYNIKR